MSNLTIKYPQELLSPFTPAAWLCDPYILSKCLEEKCSRPDILVYGVMRLVNDGSVPFDEFFRAAAVSLAMGDAQPLMTLCRRHKTTLKSLGENEWAAAVLAERESLTNDPGYPAWVYNVDLSWAIPYALLPVVMLHRKFGDGFFAGGGVDISEELAWVQAMKPVLDRVWERAPKGGRVLRCIGPAMRFRESVLKPSFDPTYRLQVIQRYEKMGKWVRIGEYGLSWYTSQPNFWVERDLVFRIMDAVG